MKKIALLILGLFLCQNPSALSEPSPASDFLKTMLDAQTDVEITSNSDDPVSGVFDVDYKAKT